MKIYVVLKSYSNSGSKFLGITDNKQNAEMIKTAYALSVGMYEPDKNIAILEYDFKGE